MMSREEAASLTEGEAVLFEGREFAVVDDGKMGAPFVRATREGSHLLASRLLITRKSP